MGHGRSQPRPWDSYIGRSYHSPQKSFSYFNSPSMFKLQMILNLAVLVCGAAALSVSSNKRTARMLPSDGQVTFNSKPNQQAPGAGCFVLAGKFAVETSPSACAI
ncbi:hypothetical protein BDN71DRAFT_1452663, partial [Pleurotus eryngii]